ncbi:MAG: alanine racemase [Kineosporiaceae bacterium]
MTDIPTADARSAAPTRARAHVAPSAPSGPPLLPDGVPAAAIVDLDAVRDNVASLRERAGTAQVMAVVKADAYGHGLVPCARAALDGGATWLGTAQLAEALALRAAGVAAPLVSWLTVPGDRFAEALLAGVDLGISSAWALTEVVAAARATGVTARVHVKVDTGLARNGVPAPDWLQLFADVLRAQAEGVVAWVGLMSHLAWADAPDHPTVAAQCEAFADAVALAERLGARLEVRHLANSAATLMSPQTHWDLVRPGLAVYGLSPVPDLVPDPAQAGLRPAMSLLARVALLKRVPAGTGVAYGHTYTTSAATTLALLPLGYADGVPRHAGNTGPVSLRGARYTVAGRVSMDQIVVDLHDPDGAGVELGDVAVLFGDGRDGGPTAEDWARAAATISYEIVSRPGLRLPRMWVGGRDG